MSHRGNQWEERVLRSYLTRGLINTLHLSFDVTGIELVSHVLSMSASKCRVFVRTA